MSGKKPVFVNGILLPSRSDAADFLDVDTLSVFKALKKSKGGPVTIRDQVVVDKQWVDRRMLYDNND